MFKKIIAVNVIAILLFSFSVVQAQTEDDTESTTVNLQEEEEQLTKEEEREALEFIKKFVSRFKEKKDYGKLTREFFVSDFKERFHAEQIRNPIFKDDNDEPLIIPADVLSDSLIEVSNLFSLISLLHKTKTNDENESSGFADVLPPELIAEIKNNKTLRRSFLSSELINKDKLKDENNPDLEDEDTNFEIKDEAGLRELIPHLSKFNEHLSEYLTQVEQTQPAKKTQNEETEETKEDEDFDVDLVTVGKDESSSFYGLPDGTQLICVHIHSLILHLDLVRVDGRLQILDITPDIGD